MGLRALMLEEGEMAERVACGRSAGTEGVVILSSCVFLQVELREIAMLQDRPALSARFLLDEYRKIVVPNLFKFSIV